MKAGRHLFCALILMLSACVPAMAVYSGLVIIPTADVVSDGEMSVDNELDSSLARDVSDDSYINTEIGFGNRYEVGFDCGTAVSGGTKYSGDCKCLLFNDAANGLSIAGGACGLQSSMKPTSYIVATKNVNTFRFHFGGQRSYGYERWFAGADRAIGDRLVLMADYTSGDENYSSIGFTYQLTDDIGIFASAEFSNAEDDTIYTLDFYSCHTLILGK